MYIFLYISSFHKEKEGSEMNKDMTFLAFPLSPSITATQTQDARVTAGQPFPLETWRSAHLRRFRAQASTVCGRH